MVALSFVAPARMWRAKQRLKTGPQDPSDREDRKARRHGQLEGILTESDGVMVARSDLGVEMTLARAGRAENHHRTRAHAQQVRDPGTQMLESMVTRSTPTRAEVTDIATIFDGTDAVMLSAETASGQYPARRLP
jgi:pyruvate kinase